MSLILQGSTSGSVTLQEPAVAGTTVLTLPATSGNVVVDSATQTLTNKTIQGGTITSGTAVASTSGTSIDFTSIPSWVQRITVMFNGVSTSSTSLQLIQIGSGSVSSSGYTSLGSAGYNTSQFLVSSSTAGFVIYNNQAAAVLSGSIVLSLISSNTWVCSAVLSNTAGVTPAMYSTSGNSPALGGALDRVRITTVNGTDTFDAGTINILYE